jgi:phosphate starvation-inducible protein PhoH and related proteins
MLQQLLLSLENMDLYLSLFGLNDRNITVLEQELSVNISLIGQELSIRGSKDNVALAGAVVEKLLTLLKSGETVDPFRVRYAVTLAQNDKLDHFDDLTRDNVAVTHRGKQIKCKTLGQLEYVNAIRGNILTFAIGPAGTGKTYLAMALAVVALRNREVERIVLTRPAVEAGEKLGFLPGDMAQKVDPYLRPLYDALYEIMGMDSYQRLMERGAIEVAPLAFMRGRTLSDAFIILDEAQNTTSEQMKMFLTRIGANSRCIVTGDISQTDLPRGRRSGLTESMEILKNVPGIAMITLTHKDVVRHELIQQIVLAYDAYEKSGGSAHEKA